MAFEAAFISRVAKQLLTNKQLNTEELQALYNFYGQPDKLNVPQLLLLLQIEAEADQTFTQDFIIQLWTAHPKILMNAAKNNRYIFKLQETLIKLSSGNSDLSKKIKEITAELRFPERDNENNPFSKQSFYKAFEKDLLPRPLMPETLREVPTEKRVAAIQKAAKNNQTIREKRDEAERKNSVVDFFKGVVTNIVDTISPKKKTVVAPVNPTISKPKQVLKNIVNAFSFIFRVKKLSESTKSQKAQQNGYDSPGNSSSGYSSPSLDQSSVNGYSSPSIGGASPGYSSPSLKDENSPGYSSPSITSQNSSSMVSNNSASASGYSSPAVGNDSPSETATSATDTKFILFHITNPTHDKSILTVTTEANARKVAKRLFLDESNIMTANSKPAVNNVPRKSHRVTEIHDDQENIDPNVLLTPEPTKMTTGFWSSPILSPTKKCSKEASSMEQPYSPANIKMASP